MTRITIQCFMFRKSDNIYTAFEELLHAYYVKMHITMHFDHVATRPSKPCMDDFLAMLEAVAACLKHLSDASLYLAIGYRPICSHIT